MGVILFIIANLLSILLFPVGFFVGIVSSFYNHHFDTGVKNVDHKFLRLATSFDKYGNVVCSELFNYTLITKDAPVPFGRIEQTISAVLGHNERAGTLTKTGRALCWILDKADKDHVAKAAIDDKYYQA